MGSEMTDAELMEQIRDPEEAIDYLLHVHRIGDAIDLKMAMDKIASVHTGRGPKNGGE